MSTLSKTFLRSWSEMASFSLGLLTLQPASIRSPIIAWHYAVTPDVSVITRHLTMNSANSTWVLDLSSVTRSSSFWFTFNKHCFIADISFLLSPKHCYRYQPPQPWCAPPPFWWSRPPRHPCQSWRTSPRGRCQKENGGTNFYFKPRTRKYQVPCVRIKYTHDHTAQAWPFK